MRDEFFEVFIEEFGEATHRIAVPEEKIEKWRGKLPDQLLKYWKAEGWSGYANGQFWIVDPEQYEDILDEWLDSTGLQTIDTFRVIARSGFGTLHLWGERTGDSVSVMCSTHSIICSTSDLKKDVRDPDQGIRNFFGHRSVEDEDMKDVARKPLFEKARKKCGDLGFDEMYGFEPALVLGGEVNLKNIVKVDLDIHLTILRGLAEPTLPFARVNIDNLIN